MQLRPNGFDVWVFHRAQDEPRYLLLRASEEKANRWFGGERFWQVPSDFVGEETAREAVVRELASHDLSPVGVWAAELVYLHFNTRYGDVVTTTVFAAEVLDQTPPRLAAGHSEARWLIAAECEPLLTFRGLIEGLSSVREYVAEPDRPPRSLKL